MKIIRFLLCLLIFSTHPVLSDASTYISSDTLPPTTKILGGTESKPGDWPWITALLVADQPDMYQAQFCGGVLIDKSWVLTAAHCVNNESPDDLHVAIGVFDLKDFSGNRISINDIRVHPLYNTTTFHNDIALLHLASPSTGQIISLFSGESKENANPSLLGRVLTAMGWGHADTGSSMYYPNKLRQVNLPAVNNSFCNNVYSTSLVSSQLCAGYYEGKDVCNGDSGGPMVTQIDGTWAHTGLVSYGSKCSDYGGWYGVYTRTSAFVDFIKQYVPNAQFTSAASTPEENKAPLSWLQLLLGTGTK